MDRTRRDFVPFLEPSVFLLAVVFVYPLGYSLWLSHFSFYLPRPPPRFVGLDNYLGLLSEAGSRILDRREEVEVAVGGCLLLCPLAWS